MTSPAPFVENAPAKVNLTLRVLGRRSDGYHEIESLVAFAEFGDTLSFSPGGELALTMRGPNAANAGEDADNLVLKAARALAGRVAGIGLGALNWTSACRLPPGSVADRLTRLQHCACLRVRTTCRSTTGAFTTPRVQSVPMCRSASTPARA